MSTISLRLPDSLHARVRQIAARENISINQFISLALAEKISALLTEEYLVKRAKRGSKTKYRRVLAKVRNVEPAIVDDRL
jgi:predicted transcriptional regulator